MNKNERPKYQKTMVLTVMKCTNCGYGAVPNKAMSCVSNDALHDLATELHNGLVQQHKLLCSTPKFVIGYSEELTDTRIIHDGVNKLNGNGN